MAKRPIPPAGEIVLYQTDDGQTRVECRFVEETLWLSQALIAELFQKDVRTINEHLQNLYTEGELDQAATIRKFRIVRREGSRRVAREVDHYNLDAILGVGYRVRSDTCTDFGERGASSVDSAHPLQTSRSCRRTTAPEGEHQPVPRPG